MKELNITFNFAVPDDIDPREINELAYYMIDQIWDEISEMNCKIKGYTINKELSCYNYSY